MTGQTGIFISHAHADQEIADVIRKKLRRFFANGVPIFLSPNTIAAGKSWLPEIEKALKCRVLLVLLTPNSLSRPWLWFEVGACWDAHRGDRTTILPVTVGLNAEDVPAPLDQIQTPDLTAKDGCKAFFSSLHDIFAPLGIVEDMRNNQFIKALQAKFKPSVEMLSTPATDALMAALGHLLEQGALKSADLSVFGDANLLTAQQIRQLKRKSSG